MDTNLRSLRKQELAQYIIRNKKILEESVIIPAHHYQISEVVDVSDFVGDSLRLAVECSRTDREFILFCGVTFMADCVSILAHKDQKVLLPNLNAGCPLADMINAESAERIYNKIKMSCKRDVIPIVYINSNADMKYFAGKYNGSLCTSSSAKKVMEYYLNKDKAVFFAPDYNLGINTAHAMGITMKEIVRINKDFTFEHSGNIQDVSLFIWDGSCYVHKKFDIENVEKLREKYPLIQIAVHPECDEEVVNSSDFVGSSQAIYDIIKNAPDTTIWGVGTEYNFVKRLDEECTQKKVLPLCDSHCYDMEKINLLHIAECIQSIMCYLGRNACLHNQIVVPEKLAKNSKKALEKMIQISGD